MFVTAYFEKLVRENFRYGVMCLCRTFFFLPRNIRFCSLALSFR